VHQVNPREETERQKAARAKVSVLKLAEQLGNVSKACKIMGVSRDSFYRFKKLYLAGGESALEETARRKPILKNRVAQEIEQAVVELALEQPALGPIRVAHELATRGMKISPGGVRCVWLRHNLERSALRRRARDMAHMAQPSPSL
jgi:hypothetical protein